MNLHEPLLTRLCPVLLSIALCLFAGCDSDDGQAAHSLPDKVAAQDRFVYVDPPELDFGDIHVGTSRVDTVRIVNSGITPVTIAKTRSTCGCTVALVTDSVIPPGESIEVDVTVRAQKSPGRLIKRVYFEMADGIEPLALPIMASVGHLASIEPASFDPRADSDQTFRIISSSVATLNIRSVTAPLRILEGSGSTLLVLTRDELEKVAPRRPLQVHVAVDDGQQFSIDVPSRQQAATLASGGQSWNQADPPPLRFEDSQLVFGTVNHGSTLRGQVLIKGLYGELPEPRIVSADRRVTATVTDWRLLDDGMAIDLELQLLPQAIGYCRGKLQVQVGERRGDLKFFATVAPTGVATLN